LIATSALGILAGGFLAEHVNPRLLTRIAGVGFVLIGAWTLLRA
jgi:putative Ca2+/H+ antiporter (TMEM165/GDT1 family)